MDALARLLTWLLRPLLKSRPKHGYPSFKVNWSEPGQTAEKKPFDPVAHFNALVPRLEEMAESSAKYFEKHCREQHGPIATNADSVTIYRFDLGLLHWGAGDVASARREFGRCSAFYVLALKAFQELRHVPAIREEFENWRGDHVTRARVAGYLVDAPPASPEAGSYSECAEGYEPWFEVAVMRACIDGAPIDADAFGRSRALWIKRRKGVTRLEDWDFYRSVLEGEWRSREPEMFQRHKEIYSRRKRWNTGNLAAGEGQFNGMVADFLFAAILKRIGWKGKYRHAWPDDGVVPPFDAAAETAVAPSGFLKGVAAADRAPEPVAEFPDYTVDEALDRIKAKLAELYEGADISCDRELAKKNRTALARLGIGPQSRDYTLMTVIDLGKLPGRHQGPPELANPWGMEERTQALRESIRMHPDFLILSMPDETLQWEEPEGTVFVYRPIDGRVYVADAEHLTDAGRVIASVTPGMSVWPSLASFLVWFVCEETD